MRSLTSLLIVHETDYMTVWDKELTFVGFESQLNLLLGWTIFHPCTCRLRHVQVLISSVFFLQCGKAPCLLNHFCFVCTRDLCRRWLRWAEWLMGSDVPHLITYAAGRPHHALFFVLVRHYPETAVIRFTVPPGTNRNRRAGRLLNAWNFAANHASENSRTNQAHNHFESRILTSLSFSLTSRIHPSFHHKGTKITETTGQNKHSKKNQGCLDEIPRVRAVFEAAPIFFVVSRYKDTGVKTARLRTRTQLNWTSRIVHFRSLLLRISTHCTRSGKYPNLASSWSHASILWTRYSMFQNIIWPEWHWNARRGITSQKAHFHKTTTLLSF